jgi:hypothetical protein
MSLRGVLSDFPVSDVFQLIAQQRKTGVLRVENGGRVLEVFFVEGDVVRARPAETRPHGALAGYLLRAGVVSESALGQARRDQDEMLEPLPRILVARGVISAGALAEIAQLTTQETIFELFLWDQGRFEFGAGQVETDEFDQRIGAERFLLDALRMRDEWADIVADLPDLAGVAALQLDFDEFRERRERIARSAGVRAEELDRLFDLINGRLSVRRVIDLSRLGTFAGGRGLVALIRAGVVRIELPAQIAPTSAWRQKRGRRLLGWTALAAGSALAAVLQIVPLPRSSSFPLPTGDPAGGDVRIPTDRVRAALEVHRWLKGEYPPTLEAVRATRSELLAGVPLDRYSYQPTGRGYELRRRLP